MKLILLREHAERVKKSLGQLADDYVAQRLSTADTNLNKDHAHSGAERKPTELKTRDESGSENDYD